VAGSGRGAELAEGPGLLLHERTASGGQRPGVDIREPRTEHGLQRAIHDRLDQRAQPQAVTGGNQVDRPAHQGEADNFPLGDQRGQIAGLEIREA
jgi:hypothetical protein